ncbi:MAG: hypothetical protein AB1502_00530 [Thermodesulfobacteriota bacterium]
MKSSILLIAAIILFISPCRVDADEYLWGKWRCESPEALKGLIVTFRPEGEGQATLGIAHPHNLDQKAVRFFYYIETILSIDDKEYIIVKIWVPPSDLRTVQVIFREDGKIEISEDDRKNRFIFTRIGQDS